MDAAAVSALIDEATKKSGLIWVRPAGPHQRGVGLWHVWQDGAAWVLGGGIEQQLPDFAERAYVIVRSKDNGARVLTWVADVRVVQPESDEWQSVLPTLMAKRLNLPDGEQAAVRWARECTLWQLTPTGELTETATNPSTNSHAVEPAPTPARSRVPKPLHLRGRPAQRGRKAAR
jgi:hypothetical protein